jgi:cytochrome c
MKRILIWCVALGLMLVPAGLLAADQAQDCVVLVDKCLAMFQEKGREATLAEIKNSRGAFVRVDLYVFALSLDNVMVAHPHEKSLHGINVTKVRDSDGKRFFEKFGAVAATQESGWVDYTWNKPGENQPSRKRSYIKRVPKEDLYVGCGYYLR